MYRDDPLDDELELRDVVGDEVVDDLTTAAADLEVDLVGAAVDVLRLLQGWTTDAAIGRWFTTPQRRLDQRSPAGALGEGAVDEVHDAARAWAAALG